MANDVKGERSSRAGKKRRQKRKKNIFRKLADSMVCCVTSQNEPTEEYRAVEKAVQKTPVDIGVRNTSDIRKSGDTARPHDKHDLGGTTDPGKVNQSEVRKELKWGDVTLLQWSRFSHVYRHGFPVSLGEGDQGYVTLMRDNQSGKLVAVKSWHLDSDVTVVKKTFQYELEAMLTFSRVKGFPELVGILPNPESAVSFSLVQEFIGDQRTKDSSSLLEAIGSGNLTEGDAISMALETAEALREMHRKGWVHCDLKNDNVMIQKGSQTPPPSLIDTSGGWFFNELPTQTEVHAKLIDFGSARPLAFAKMSWEPPKKMKKYIYQMCRQMAPEVVEGLGKVPYSYESDIYSLGRLLKDISESCGILALDKVADRCMSKSPERRPEIDTVIQALSKIKSG